MSIIELKNKRLLVLGMGRTGVAVARAAQARGAGVTLLEKNEAVSETGVAQELRSIGVKVIFGPHRLEELDATEIVVPSPGISPATNFLIEAGQRGLEIISEIELAYRLTKRPVIAVTGTNGKTTTATLIGEVLMSGGIEADVCGNIGRTMIEAISSGSTGPLVVEASSFQLHYTEEFSPHIGLLLNISPDHIDWHGSFQSYREAKIKMFGRQESSDWLVGEEGARHATLDGRGRKVWLGASPGVLIDDGWICQDFIGAPGRIVEVGELTIRGDHNRHNAMAAAAVGLICEVGEGEIAGALTRFRGVEHRLERVAEIEGVEFYNDSKATNPEAAIKAIEAFPGKVILLAGGRNKGNRFDELAVCAKGRVKFAACFGESAEDIERAFADAAIETARASGLSQAVELARAASMSGDTVLLSPACASQDMFLDYADRGRQFKAAVLSKVVPVGKP